MGSPIASGMEGICKGIVGGYEDRKKVLHQVKKEVKNLEEQTEAIRDNARKFMGDCQKSHKDMAKNLKESLFKDREGRTKQVDSLRKDFHRSQKEVRADVEGASKAWQEMRQSRAKKGSK